MHQLLKVAKKLSVLNAKLFAIPFELSTHVSTLEYLDISEKIFSDIALSQMMCDGIGVPLNLQTINVDQQPTLHQSTEAQQHQHEWICILQHAPNL